MKQTFTLLVFFLGMLLHSQNTISGTFSPAEEFNWLIAYHLKPGGQAYIADTAIKDGTFTLNIPENSKVGTYRLVYAVPQDEFYFDVLYTGKEAIELNFDLDNGVSFISSEENKLFLSYFQDINRNEQQLVDFYTAGSNDQATFQEITTALETTQATYEKKAENLFSQKFIIANRGYVPETLTAKQDYIKNKKEAYFAHIKFDDTDLQASDFLIDKALNYVFTALPSELGSLTDIKGVLKDNVATLASHLEELPDAYQFYVFHKIWEQTAANNLNEVSDLLLNTYMTPKAHSIDHMKLLDEIAAKNRLRVGAIAPELEWVDDTTVKRLSTLEGAEHYLLVFWSSTCGHCLKELPALHKELKTKPTVKVIAVGLENDERTWKPESAKLDDFEHAISLGRWESEYAKLYDIHSTPTYYVLDEDKRILAKPENDTEVVRFFEEHE